METLNFKDLSTEKLGTLIAKKASFKVIGLSGKVSEAASLVEDAIEKRGMRCRVYTAGRVTAAGASFFGGVTGAVGVISALGMAAHNIATYNPDYEIAKHLVDNQLTVTFKKS